MKHSLIFIFFLLIATGLFSQKVVGKDFYIVYVDKNPSGEGLNGAMMQDLLSLMDSVNEKKQFVFFVSNRKDYQLTDNPRTVNTILDGLIIRNTEFPDQNYDVSVLREKLLKTLSNFKGKVHLVFYISNRLLQNAQEKYSPLLGLFPKEFAQLYSPGITGVDVTINYPKLASSSINETEIKTNLEFSAVPDMPVKVNYKILKF